MIASADDGFREGGDVYGPARFYSSVRVDSKTTFNADVEITASVTEIKLATEVPINGEDGQNFVFMNGRTEVTKNFYVDGDIINN